MISNLELYMILKLTDIVSLNLVIAIISFLVVIIVSIFCSIEEAWTIFGKNICIIGLCIFIISSTVCTLLPTTKQMAAIIIIPAMINDEKVQTITSNGLNILEEYTKELLDDMKRK